jgi:hypothetical protein
MDHYGLVDTAASSSLYRGHRYPVEIMILYRAKTPHLCGDLQFPWYP